MSALQAGMSLRGRSSPQVMRSIDTIPAPYLGWNARDSLDEMDPRFALVMDNYFPDGSGVRLRNGSADHATGITGPVEYLHKAVVSGKEVLVAFANNSAYDATPSGSVGAPFASGFSNNRWIGANAGASGGERAIYTNGADVAQAYDGTTWQSAGLTGPSLPNGITVVNKRIWVYEEGTGSAWYGPPEAVTGALAKFDLSSVSPKGGELVGIGNLSIDGGQGPDDYTVFVMKGGSVIIYVGTDPADAANWALRGVWQAGTPIGNKCLVKFDKDLILITNEGFKSILSFTTGGGLSSVPISDNVRNAVSEAARQYKNNYGWNGFYNPRERQLIFNIPVLEARVTRQFVMNSVGFGWCQFTNQNALCHESLGDQRYIGVNGKVMVADVGGTDGTEPINGTVQTAWRYPGIKGRDKHFKQYRVKIRSDGGADVSLGLGVNFKDPNVYAPASIKSAVGGVWGEAEWGVADWGGGLINEASWRGANRKGFNASIVAKTQTTGAVVQYLSSDLLYEVSDI